MAKNYFSDLGALALTVQEDAVFVIRESGTVLNLIKQYNDASGGNTRTIHSYNSVAAAAVAENADMTSASFAPSAGAVLTPGIVGAQVFISDLRAASQAPEAIMTDAATELGRAALDKINADVVGDLTSLTGGTIGAAGTAITWGYLAAAIAQARNANKSDTKPLACVMHGYQWAVLAKAASVAGATVYQGELTDKANRSALASFMNVPIYQTFVAPDAEDDFTGGVFPREALAMDWRQGLRIEAQRDASFGGGGVELNMTAVYAHGVNLPARGVEMIFDATAPTS